MSRWTPIAVREPVPWQSVYVTCHSLIDNREDWVIDGVYTPLSKWEMSPMLKAGDAEVTAWMPKELPKPYRQKTSYKMACEYQRRKDQRQERRDAHKCTRCGVPLPDDDIQKGLVTCKRCRDMFRLVYYPQSKRAGLRRAWDDRGKNGDCWQCGKILPKGYEMKVCQECIAKRKAGMRRKKGE